jgi:two-component system sensor kinase FixL
MDEGAIAFETLSIALFALGTGAVVTGALSLSAAERPGGFWLIGWAAILLPGGFFAGEAGGWGGASTLGFMIDGLFAPLMLMGCLALRRDFDTPWWPLFAGSLAGVARVVFIAWDLPVLEALLAVTLAPALFALASRTMWRAPEGTWFRRTIAGFFAAFALIEFVDGALDAIGGTNTVLYGVLAALGLPLAAMQIASRVHALRVGLTSAEAASAAAERRRDVDRAHFHGLFDEVKELVAELDAETRIIFVNARARELFGLEPDEIVGLRAIDFVPAEVRSVAEENWKAQLGRGGLDRPVTFALPAFGIDGRDVFLEINVSRQSFDGKPRYLVLARDVTGRQEGEAELEARLRDLESRIAASREELRAARRRLEDQERLAVVGTLASGIAHQINNPLGAIRAASDFALLESGSSDGPRVAREALERIGEEAARAGRIVKSVLRFARHGATPKWIDDLVPVVRRSAELCREYVDARAGSLEIHAPDEVLPVLMSPIEIEQLVVNLVRNAAESRESGVRIEVTVERHPTAAIARVLVDDDGRGIPEEALPDVFDPFYTTRLRDGGSGLGLSVAHGIVEDHGGTIRIESKAGDGTRLIVELPLRPERS